MNAAMRAPRDIDEYIDEFPAGVQKILKRIRATIHKAAPQARETISYKIPTFTVNGKYLIYFAGFKKHVSVYPAPMGEPKFKTDVARFGQGKGTLKFPIDQPIPYGLITRLVKYRLKERLASRKTA